MRAAAPSYRRSYATPYSGKHNANSQNPAGTKTASPDFSRSTSRRGVQRMRIERSDHPHLLEWHSANCLALAEHCPTPRVKTVLRLLAADFALEADALRRRARSAAGAAARPLDPAASH